MSSAAISPDIARRNRRAGIIALSLAVGMLGLGYAAVPLYRIFCEATGFGLSKSLITGMLDIMPSRSLVRHQWNKHGTCTGLGGDAYFDASVHLVREMQATRLSKVLRANIGKEVPRRGLLDAFEAACAGVWLHGRAGALAGPALIADDLLTHLREALAECR